MNDVSDEEYAELGKLAEDLSPIAFRETPVNHVPPVGAGKLLDSGETVFIWEPIPTDAWRGLSDVERGRIVADRAAAWLERNAELITAPFSFVADPDEQVNRAFGINAHNVHDALCATYRMLMTHEEAVEYGLVGLAAIATVSAGAHAVVLGLHATAAIVKTYGRRRCDGHAIT